MKKVSALSDFVCFSGNPSLISSTLNKINSMYEVRVCSMSTNSVGLVTVIVERRKREEVKNSEQ